MAQTNEPIRVLIVDRTAVGRRALRLLLLHNPGIAEIETTIDTDAALEKADRFRPSVVLVDVEMPNREGYELVRALSRDRGLPVLVVSNATPPGSTAAAASRRAGAVGVILKDYISAQGDEAGPWLALRVFAAADGAIDAADYVAKPDKPYLDDASSHAHADPISHEHHRATRSVEVIAIGASMGGTTALPRVLAELDPTGPPVLIVQHMPSGFTRAFAQRLNSQARVQVREAVDGEELQPGVALLAPGDRHLRLTGRPGWFRAQVREGPKIRRHRPSVDALFESIAVCAGPTALGVILTGMGDDGAAGLALMRDRGAVTIAQDESSCVVFGMPREAIRLDAAAHVERLDRIGPLITELAGAPLIGKRVAG